MTIGLYFIRMLEVFIDSLLDSLKVLGLAFALYVLLSFLEGKIAKLLEKRNRFAPLYGSLFGVIPQCGISVVAADLYTKHHLTMGTLVAIFVSCSDEALPVIFSDFQGKWYMGFALLGIKIVGGFIFGYILDSIFYSKRKEVEKHNDDCPGEEITHIGCCGHEIEEKEDESPLHEHFLHPLVHSLKIFLYAFIVSFLFGTLMFYYETQMQNFLLSNRMFSPLIAIVIGLIPNCASSVMISNLYIVGGLPFGALVSGLSVNAGLGTLYLFKDKKTLKDGFIVLSFLLVISVILGYSFIWVG